MREELELTNEATKPTRKKRVTRRKQGLRVVPPCKTSHIALPEKEGSELRKLIQSFNNPSREAEGKREDDLPPAA